MKYLIITLQLCLLFCACATHSTQNRQQASYGRWEKFSSTETLKFPEFDLKFLGAQEGNFYPGSNTHRMGEVYEFQLSKGTIQIVVSWSSGTGDIGPVFFTIDGQSYFLEMQMSSILGMPNSENALAVWPEADYNSRTLTWWRFW